jgi:bifunctional UDP-N-acetylglucosamine pyrophosphorylase/glucosamine-1-phosphate N-acetyltransferase
MTTRHASEAPVAVVLAAGQGTRMRSSRAKVLHHVAGKRMLQWVLEAARSCGCRRCLVVVGHGSDEVRDAFSDEDVTWVEQTEQLGTGHALAQVRDHVGAGDRLLVLSGDVPGIRAATLSKLLTAASESWGSMAVAEMDDPGALGRVVRRDDGSLESIVEAVDASPEELAMTTVNAGVYVLPVPAVFEYLDALTTDNRKGELYLTDALVAAAARHRIDTVLLDDWREAMGVNDRHDLGRAHRALVDRAMRTLSEQGVTIYEPARTVVEAAVVVGRDSEIHPGASLLGSTSVGEGCVIGAGAWIRDCEIGDRVEVHPYSVLDGAAVGDETSIGPFARLRPGTRIGQGARVGNFVEVKNSRLGDGVKAGHLAYLGDTEVGEDANIGAGVVTCNYDGRDKHRTTIGKRAFIGSDTMLVAPVTVGDDSTTGAGSVITADVPDGALGVERSKQRNVEGWSQRRRAKDD